MSKPKRAWELELKVGGDTKEDGVRLLNEFVEDIERGSDGGVWSVSGSPSSGGFYGVHTNAEMTHERYCEELAKYLETT